MEIYQTPGGFVEKFAILLIDALELSEKCLISGSKVLTPIGYFPNEVRNLVFHFSTDGVLFLILDQVGGK